MMNQDDKNSNGGTAVGQNVSLYHCCTCSAMSGITCVHLQGSGFGSASFCSQHSYIPRPPSDNELLAEILKELKNIKSELEIVKGRIR